MNGSLYGWVISPLVIHLPVTALTSPPGIIILTRIYELDKQTNACSANSRQHTKRKQQKTAAEATQASGHCVFFFFEQKGYRPQVP